MITSGSQPRRHPDGCCQVMMLDGLLREFDAWLATRGFERFKIPSGDDIATYGCGPTDKTWRKRMPKIQEVWHGWKCDACGCTFEYDDKPTAGHSIYDPFQHSTTEAVACPGEIVPETIVKVIDTTSEIRAEDIDFPPHPSEVSGE